MAGWDGVTNMNSDEQAGYMMRAIEDLTNFVQNHMAEENQRFLRVEDKISAMDKKLNVLIVIFVAVAVLILGPKAVQFIGLLF